jgi:hypothetical protein
MMSQTRNSRAKRDGEVAGMEWPEIDLVKRVWTIPRHKYEK